MKFLKLDNSNFSGRYIFLYSAFSDKEGALKEWEEILAEWKALREKYDSIVTEHRTALNEFRQWMKKYNKLFVFSKQRISALESDILHVNMHFPSQPYLATEYQDKNGKVRKARYSPRFIPNPKTFDEFFEICKYSSDKQDREESEEEEKQMKAIKYCVEHGVKFTIETAFQDANDHAFNKWEEENPCPDDVWDEEEEIEYYYVCGGNFVEGFYWYREH